MMSESNASPEFSMLPDEPANVDEFGSHEKVAQGIAQIISGGVGAKTIGIEGDWGSGKSTIVGFVEREFNSDDDTQVVFFDAWAHEGDPLRRSFLEHLIARLLDLKWVSKKKWDKVLTVLGKRTIDTRSTITKDVTGAGKFLAFAATLVPVGALLLNAEDLSAQESTIGFSMVAAPLFVIALVGVINFFRSLFGHKKLGFLESDREERIYSTVNQDPEPTSIEFRKHFVSLMREALASDPKRKLVLVVDNMDRINVPGANTIWSTLRVFLEKPSTLEENYLEQVWVIIPYDRSAIFSHAENEGENNSAFKDKVIQTTFYAPTPVLSDWQTFLNNKLKDAFPGSSQHFQEQFHRVYRLYAIAHSGQERRITPRDLILFVNEIGSLYCQWQDDVPLPELAYYVILRRKGDKIVNGLLDGSIPGKNSLPLLGKDPAGSLAAVHYNVERDKAGQFLLRDPIVNCLEKGNGETLMDLLKKHKEAHFVLEISLPDLINEWLPSETQKFYLCVGALSHCLELLDEPRRATTVDEIVSAARQIKLWTKFDEKTVDGLANLLDFDDSLCTAISQSLSATLNASTGSEESVFEWPDSISRLVGLLDALGKSGKFKLPKYQVHVSAADWLSIAPTFVSSDKSGRYWKTLKPRFATEDHLNEHLVSCFTQSELPKGAIEVLRISAKSKEKINRTQILNQITMTLSEQNAVLPESIRYYVEAMILLGKQEKNEKWRVNLAKSGMALHLFYKCHTEGAIASASYCMLLHLAEFPAMSGNAAVFQSPNGLPILTKIVASPDSNEELVVEFVKLAERHGLRGKTVGRMITDASSGEIFAASCLNQMTHPEFTFSKDRFLEVWPILLEQTVEEKLEDSVLLKIVDRQIKEHELEKSVIELDFKADAVRLYSSVLISEESDSQRFSKWLAAEVEKFTVDDFLEIIQKNSELLQLFTTIKTYHPSFSLSTAFCDAIVSHGVKAIAGKGDVAWDDELQDQVFNLIEADQRKTVQDQLRSEATKAEGAIDKKFFDWYGSEISDPDSLRQDGTVVSDLFSDLVKQQNVDGVNWIIDVLENENFLGKYKPKHHVTTFRKRVIESLNDIDDSESTFFELARVMGLQVPDDESDSAKD